MAAKLQLPPLSFERGSLTADFQIPDSPPRSRPVSPSQHHGNTNTSALEFPDSRKVHNSDETAVISTDGGIQHTVAEKLSDSNLRPSPNSPPISPHSPRPGSVRRLLSKMSLSGSYKESDEASVVSIKSPVSSSHHFSKDSDALSDRASTTGSRGFFSAFKRNSSKRSTSSNSSKAAVLPVATAPRAATIEEKTAEVLKKNPPPQIPDISQKDVSGFDSNMFKNI